MSAGDPVFWFMAGMVGLIYAVIIHVVQRRAPGNPYTSMWVVGGVLICLALAALVLNVREIAIVTGVFAATGLWQIVGSMYRWLDEQRARRDGGHIRRSLED